MRAPFAQLLYGCLDVCGYRIEERDCDAIGCSLLRSPRRKPLGAWLAAGPWCLVCAGGFGQALDLLRDGKPARLTDPKDADEERILRQAQLLTSKPVLYVCNVEEANAATGNAHSEAVFARAKAEGAQAVIVSAAIESELVGMDGEERMMFLEEMGLHETGLARVIRAGYELLHLLTFFTVGPKEARAWTVHTGATAPEAAGEIHSDFQKGFIRAETIAYDDYVALGGEAKAREAGKLRAEGKAYVVHDGDVMHFLHS